MLQYAKGLLSPIFQSGCIRPLDLDAVNRFGTVSQSPVGPMIQESRFSAAVTLVTPTDQSHFDLIYVCDHFRK